MSPAYGDPDEEYTKCHECGEWDGKHLSTCLAGLKTAYVGGHIEMPEFERRVQFFLRPNRDDVA